MKRNHVKPVWTAYTMIKKGAVKIRAFRLTGIAANFIILLLP
jgi:hypothetical protein